MSLVFLRIGLFIATEVAGKATPEIAAIIARLITSYEAKQRKKRRRIRRKR
jgi:hypothetical protein